MKYAELTSLNKVGEEHIKDGYNGKTTYVSYHLVNGVVWVKAYCGCFRK